ncbi:MAG: hypothetical protein N2314_05800 [Brevinematales bacterium]|nr:hypothetical protein [Brevinematales bacterium]
MQEFLLREGKNQNIFLEEEGIRYHVVISDEGKLLVATPSGNSGILLVWRLPGGDGRVEYLGCSELWKPFAGGHGVAFTIKVMSSSLALRGVWMESLRWIRDMESEEGRIFREKIAREFSETYPLGEGFVAPCRDIRSEGEKRVVVYRRISFGQRHHYKVELEIEKGEVGEEGGEVRLVGKNFPFEVRVRVGYSFGLERGRREVLEQKVQRDMEAFSSGWYIPAVKRAKQALHFLSLENKVVAGSFRFLTYFGRDTLLTSLLLQPVVEKGWFRMALQSVVERLSYRGEVAHEEDIGDQAVFRRMEVLVRLGEVYGKKEACRLLKDMYRPLYDYKMVDDDFLLPLVVKSFLEDERWDGVTKRDFLESRTKNPFFSCVAEALLQNFEWCVKQATPFAQRPSYRHFIPIKDSFVGDWRDSSQGLGFGVYSFSVNAVFVPVALKAIRQIWQREESSPLHRRAKKYARRYPFLVSFLEKGEEMERAWSSARGMFLSHLDAGEVFERLERYRAFVEGKDQGYEAFLQAVEKNPRYQKWLRTEKPVLPSVLGFRFSDQRGLFLYPRERQGFIQWYNQQVGRNDFPFYVLSLGEQGEKRWVMHSDVGMLLAFEELTAEEVENILVVLQLGYPLGLDTPVGIVVANPSLSQDAFLYYALDRRAYHGTVVWGWQQVLLQVGLIRQYQRMKAMGNEGLAEKISWLLARLWERQKTAQNFLTSELWSWRVEDGEIVPLPYGVEQESATESNPYQLWSTSFLTTVYLYKKHGLIKEEV